MKATIFAAVLATAASGTAAFATNMTCDDVSMATMKTDMMAVEDQGTKEMAINHTMMAADAMKPDPAGRSG